MSDHDHRPVDGLDCLRDHLGVGMHVPQGGGVISTARQRHGVHVDIRQFVDERAKVVGFVPGAWDEKH